jgi:glutamate racemase
MIAANIDYLVLGCSHYHILYHRLKNTTRSYSNYRFRRGGGKTNKTYLQNDFSDTSDISPYTPIQTQKYCKKLSD